MLMNCVARSLHRERKTRYLYPCSPLNVAIPYECNIVFPRSCNDHQRAAVNNLHGTLNHHGSISEKKLQVPRPVQIFGIAEVEDVFQLMQSGRNAGKLAIEMREEDVVEVYPPNPPTCVSDVLI
jgi:hypothetical protein